MKAVWDYGVTSLGTLNIVFEPDCDFTVPINPLTLIVDPNPILLPVIVTVSPLNDTYWLLIVYVVASDITSNILIHL